MAVVGEAQVRITPDTKGFEQDLKDDVEAPVAKSAKRIGKQILMQPDDLTNFFAGVNTWFRVTHISIDRFLSSINCK